MLPTRSAVQPKPNFIFILTDDQAYGMMGCTGNALGSVWKYIRYYSKHNASATQKIQLTQQMDIPLNTLLYGVHDNDIAIYRAYAEGPLQGEAPVYEELYHLEFDPVETSNLLNQAAYHHQLAKLRGVWQEQIQ